MMNMTCRDRDRIFEDGTAAEWAALEAHAASCPVCTEEIRVWRELSVAAKELRDDSEGPSFWPRIERALREEAARTSQPAWWKKVFSFWPGVSPAWQTALAGALVLVLAVSAGWLVYGPKQPAIPPDKSLLQSSTLKEVEDTEAAYERAIDKLAAQAKSQLDDPATPLLANYHEKLLVLDSAISDLRAQAGMNPSNAHLRYQLLAMYQEKQRTLEEVLEARQ